MGDFKTYTVGFDLADRFSARYDAIFKKIDRIAGSVNHKIAFDADTASAGQKIDALAQKAERANSTIARSTSRATDGFNVMGRSLDSLKAKFKGLADVADEFSNMTQSLARGDILGAGRAGGSLMGNAGKGLAAATGLSTGALLVGGGVLAAGALTVPGAATWEKQIGRASKTALDEGGGYSQRDLGGDMLNALMDVKGINQESLVAAVGQAGSLGYTNDTAIKAAMVGSKAGAAFDIETGEAMRLLGVVNQMWADQADEIGGTIVMMEKAGSAVNVLGNKYASSESNILQFLSEAGGLAKVWDMDVAETAAVGSLLETVNIKASEGETMFRSALNAGIFQKKALPADLEKSLKRAGINAKGEMGYDIAGALLNVSGTKYQEMLSGNMADTMLATVDAILEKSGGDSALAQQMSEAVFGSYGQGFLRLGGQRGNLAEMVGEATKGFDAGTSMNEEYAKQTNNLIDTFGQSMKIIGALGKVVGGFLLPPLVLLLTVFNGLLGPVAKLAIVLQNALFKQVDKLISRFMGTNLGQDLTKGIGAMMDTAGKIWETLGPILVKLLEGLLDVISGPMMAVLWLISAIYDKVRPYLLQMVEGVLAIVDKLKGMWNWLMDAIPGARKEEARIALERQAKREGLAITPAGSIVKADRFGQPIATSGAAGEASETLLGLQAKYLALPGFAEGIADAVKKGVASIGDTIADKIAGALPDWEIPSFDDLTAAMDRLAEAIPGASDWKETGSRVTSSTGDTYFLETDSSGNTRIKKDVSGWLDEVVNPEDVPQDVRDALNIGHAAGLTFTGTGIYAGKFHGPEEVLSQASTIRGPGIIARAMEALDGATRGSSPAYNQAGGPITIAPVVKADFSGAKFTSETDIEQMLDKMAAKMEEVAMRTTKRAIGNRRT